MRISNWRDYELVDASAGERLERWKDIILIRPDPQVIWQSERKNKLWKMAHARYHRANTGGGHWEILKKVPEVWAISYKNLRFNLKMMNFKHTGIFPEQATNWDYIMKKVAAARRELKILNLFAYTGAATLAAASAGGNVCHVDASKGMVAWARENAVVSGLANNPIRWLVDDCVKFVEKEKKRGRKYHGIIMDPPSYGRGPNGEVWKLEEKLYDLLSLCCEILDESAEFLVLNSYTTGLSPAVMEYLLGATIKAKFGGRASSSEIGLPVSSSGLILPCGATAIWEKAANV